MSKLLLNLATISTKTDANLTVGLQRYEKDKLDRLRRDHRGDYFFSNVVEKTVPSSSLYLLSPTFPRLETIPKNKR